MRNYPPPMTKSIALLLKIVFSKVTTAGSLAKEKLIFLPTQTEATSEGLGSHYQ